MIFNWSLLIKFSIGFDGGRHLSAVNRMVVCHCQVNNGISYSKHKKRSHTKFLYFRKGPVS